MIASNHGNISEDIGQFGHGQNAILPPAPTITQGNVI